MTEPANIEVNPSPIVPQLWAGLRQLLPVIATYAIARGWMSSDLVTLLTGVAGIVVPIVIGQLRTWKREGIFRRLARSRRVPDDEVRMKGEQP